MSFGFRIIRYSIVLPFEKQDFQKNFLDTKLRPNTTLEPNSYTYSDDIRDEKKNDLKTQ